jgi:hypothetical protein
MKKLFTVLLILVGSLNAKAQVEVDNVMINDLDLEYVELVGRSKFFSLTKIKVFVDYGQDFSWKQQTIKDSNGKNMSFNSMVDALNFMDRNGW